MASMDYENENGTRYEDEAPRYERDRSASPRPMRRDASPRRDRRSASPGGRNGDVDSRGPPKNDRGAPQDDGAVNPGSNLFVTGIHPRLSEEEVTRLFEKYGDVEKCQIMVDPHTKESRGFGFVKMVTAEQADAAKEGLQGEVYEGRTLSIEKARRARPRTPTPGKYFGPPKPDGPPRGGGRYNRYDDRRDGGRGSYGRDYGRRDYGDDRGYRRDPYPPRDRYERDDRYGGGRDRRGGGRDDAREGGYIDRYERRDERRDERPREAPRGTAYGDPAPPADTRDSYGGRGYDDNGPYRR